MDSLYQILIALGVVGVLVVVSKKLFKVNPAQIPPKATSLSDDKASVFLDGSRKSVPLIEKIVLTHDTRLFRFGLPTPDTVLGLPVGKHFRIYCPNAEGKVPGEWNGQPDKEAGKKEITRSYTPTSSDDDLGHFDLVIKVYKGGVIDRFPDGGKVSQYLDSLNVGDSVDISGPNGLVSYSGEGTFLIKRKPTTVKNVGMIAGGTGITPMLQLIAAVLKNPKDKTKISLLFANQTEDDILVRDKLEAYQRDHPDQFSLWYTLDRPGENWKYSSGFISDQMIKEHLPPPADDTLVVMCGPPIMITRACEPNLDKLGYSKTSYVAF